MDRRHFLAGLVALGAAACTRSAGSRSDASDGDDTPQPTTTTTPPTTTVPPTTTTRHTGPATYVTRGPAGRPRVALTVHTNGDTRLVQQLFDAAARVSVPLTLFVVGDWLDQNPSMGSALVASGHELANHTYTHPSLTTVSRAVVAQEIARGADALQRHTGTRGRFFRPSGTETSTTAINEEAGAAGYAVVLGFDVDPLDYQDPGAGAVQQRVLSTTTAGSIVSLHTGHPGTITALEPIVNSLRARGLELVRASRLLDI